LPLALGFLHGLKLKEMPCFKGFGEWSSLFRLIVEIYFQIIGKRYWQWSSTCHVARVASNGDDKPNQTKPNQSMKQSFPLPSRAELDSAFVAIYRSDMAHIHKQTLLVLMERAKREADRKFAKLSK
jgi:hypothetical protein